MTSRGAGQGGFLGLQTRWWFVIAVGVAFGIGLVGGGGHALAAGSCGGTDTEWNNAAGGNWFTAGNWTNGVPTSGRRACVLLAGTYTITIPLNTSAAAGGLEVGNANATISLEAGAGGDASLTLSAASSNAGTIRLGTANVNGAHLVTSGANVLVSSGTIHASNALGGTGGLTLNAFIDNHGTVDIDRDTTLPGSTRLSNLAAAATIDIGNGATLTANSAAVENLQGAIATNTTGLLLSNLGTFRQGNGTITGTNPVLQVGGTLDITGSGAGEITTRGSTTFTGNIAASQTVNIEAAPIIGGASLTMNANTTNNGIIVLRTQDTNSASLVTTGTNVLTNNGTIRASTVGGGTGGLTLSALIDNHGTVDIDRDTTLPGSTRLSNLAAAATLDIANGATLTANSAAVENLTGAINSAATGQLLLLGSTFKQANASIIGSPVIVRGGTLSFPASPAGDGDGSIRIEGSVTVAGGTVDPLETVVVSGRAGGDGVLTHTAPMTNAGTIRMTSSNTNGAAFNESGSNPFTNTGSFLVDTGAGGTRTTNSTFINKGIFQPGKGPQGLVSAFTFDETQAPAGTWQERITDTTTDFDHATHSGSNAVKIGGTLNITEKPAVEPALGTTIRIESGGAVTGTFASVTQTLYGSGKGWAPVYGANFVDLKLVDLSPPAALISPDPILVTDQTSVSVSGTCNPGATVDVVVSDSDGGTADVPGSQTCTGGGTYNVVLDVTTLVDGTVTASVTQVVSGLRTAAATDTATKNSTPPTTTTTTSTTTTTTTVPTTTTSTSTTTTSTTSTTVPTTTTTTAPQASTVRLTSPNGGEHWHRGQAVTITWKFTGPQNRKVTVKLLRAGNVVATLTTNAPIGNGEAGSTKWVVPRNQTASDRYRIRVSVNGSSPVASDSSDRDFDIALETTPTTVPPTTTTTVPHALTLRVTSPNGGEHWQRGAQVTITWKYSGPNNRKVTIKLLRAGNVVATLTTNAPIGSGGAGATTVVVPNSLVPAGNYRIRASVNGSSPALLDDSDASFFIA